MRSEVLYSPKLDLMCETIRSFISNTSDPAVLAQTHRAIEDFCYGYSTEFRLEFLKRIGITNDTLHPAPLRDDLALEEEFIQILGTKDGECIFLLKDTAQFLDAYKNSTGKGIGIEINRKFLGGEEIYFDLVHTTYKSLGSAATFDSFLQNYCENLKEVLSKNPDLGRKTFEVSEYVRDKPKVIWVDTGFQFTINLFCYACVRINLGTQISQDMYNFTICPWLTQIFEDKYFTKENELGLGIEARSSALMS